MALARFTQHGGNEYNNIHIEGGRTVLGNVYGESSDERTLKAILDSLSYTGMTDRRDTLREAQEGTLDWTFSKGKTKFLKQPDFGYEMLSDYYEDVEMNFKTWLEADYESLFCVMGKPGSGKSTFMKTLAVNTNLDHILQAWTKDNGLLRADHYFWILGGHMQKSLEDLLRALLHTLLLGVSRFGDSETLEKIKHICGARWQSIGMKRAWSCRELKEMLTRLAQTSTAKILILIDALDEYELQDRVGDLANEIIWLSQLPNVKLCVSCRPWAIFTRRFEGFSVLHLDQLTYHDMEVYIEQRLLSTEEEANLCSTFHEGTVSSKSLIRQVAFAAEGVFLWVELVVNALCSEIRKGCPIEQLSLILSDFPTDLDDYFRDLIFGRIGNTRPNVSKTAAALKLAMVIQDGKDYSMNSNVGRMPISDDYLNFWLLSIGHLKPGFSWTDQMDPQLLASNDRYKLRQTKAFLEETCKDLLVVQERLGAIAMV